jgi:hypothetical protein
MSPEITYPLYVALAFYVLVTGLLAVGLFCLFRALVRGIMSAIASRSRFDQDGKASAGGPAPLSPAPGKA